MPIHQGTDSNGLFYQYGNSGKKYYFTRKSEKKAYQKARLQTMAIKSNEARRSLSNDKKRTIRKRTMKKRKSIRKRTLKRK
jgi:hypothetical protein